MLSQKSLLTIQKNSKSFTFTCDPDSQIGDVKSSLLEMLGYVQTVIDNAVKQTEESKAAIEKPEVVTE